MGQRADHVFTDPASIDHLHMLVEQLPDNAHVLLLLKDGQTLKAIVSARPSIQTFIDPDHREGLNAEVRLERINQPDWWRSVWLDQIASVQHLDSTLASAN